MLQSQLKSWDIPAEKVMLEITETAMMLDPTHARDTLQQLNALGVKLAVDDFGTGFSSLAYLKQLPVQELKIDKSFVMEMVHDENDAVIVRSTIDLAHNLGLRVVAEGVETQEIRDLLEILDCDVIQGYLLSRPLPAGEARKWLAPLKQEGKVHHIRDYR
jgi:EAL domain-containing protein (putative c-di-GMP-specific phosphodiesterase class I)